MTDIMKLADAYAWYSVHGAETTGEPVIGARDALQSAIEALQAENASLKQIAELNAQIAIDLKAERDALQAKLDAMGKGEPVAYRAWFDADNGARWLFTLWPKEERLDVEWEPLFAAPKSPTPEQVEAAWRAGWEACRDAEYVGQEAEDEAWGMSKTCANADWESAAPKALAPEPLTDDFLQSNDYYLLHRFIEKIDDGEGYDITQTEIKRLADLGVVQSHGFGRYSVTMFGYWVHERYWEQNPSLPLKTNSDRDAEAAHGIGGTP